MGATRGAGPEKKFDALGVGCSAVDYLGIVPRFPEPDVKMQMLDLVQQGGGLAATAMVTVARLGGRAAYVGKVGDDGLGQFILRELEREGVSTRHTVVRKGGSARFAFVLVDGERGTRTIVWSQKGVEPLTAEEVPAEAVRSARVLLVDEYEPAASPAAARIALDAGIAVVLDAERVSEATRELVSLCPIVIVPSQFAREFTGKHDTRAAGRTMHEGHGGVVLLTAGSEGAYFFGEDEEFFQPSFAVDVVDTTGAGDVFHGAFAFGYARGWAMRETTEFASAVAALKCRRLGGRTGIPSLPEALAFLAGRSGGAWVGRSGEASG